MFVRHAQKWFNITSLMTVIDADVHGASQLFPDVENEPKVANDALIDVSNRTDVLFCLFSANIDDAADDAIFYFLETRTFFEQFLKNMFFCP